mgnify:CR=1 FL=1
MNLREWRKSELHKYCLQQFYKEGLVKRAQAVEVYVENMRQKLAKDNSEEADMWHGYIKKTLHVMQDLVTQSAIKNDVIELELIQLPIAIKIYSPNFPNSDQEIVPYGHHKRILHTFADEVKTANSPKAVDEFYFMPINFDSYGEWRQYQRDFIDTHDLPLAPISTYETVSNVVLDLEEREGL